MRIVVIDSEPDRIASIQQALEDTGHDLRAARSAEEALHAVQLDRTRLALIDWASPALDAPAMCQQLRETELDGGVYIIAVLPEPTAAEVAQAMSAGADDVVGDPISAVELCSRVRIAERVLTAENTRASGPAHLATERGDHRRYATGDSDRIARDPGVDRDIFARSHGLRGVERDAPPDPTLRRIAPRIGPRRTDATGRTGTLHAERDAARSDTPTARRTDRRSRRLDPADPSQPPPRIRNRTPSCPAVACWSRRTA